MTIKFKNHYNQIGRKKDFKIKYHAEDMTDQSQLSSASICEMAKRYGIDAIIAKAKQTNIEADSALAGKLYGHDYTNMFNSKEEMLNVKKKLNNLFENIPAEIRKKEFNDDPMQFINAYTTNNENKLSKLADIGIVSKSQLEQVKKFNANRRAIEAENLTRQNFINELEKQQGAMYENFKKNGNITFNNMANNTTPVPSVSPSIPESNM